LAYLVHIATVLAKVRTCSPSNALSTHHRVEFAGAEYYFLYEML